MIGSGAYAPEPAAEAIAAKRFDLISFGKLFIANPDRVARLREARPLAAYGHALTLQFE